MSAILHSILDTHPDMICRYDADLTMTYANTSAATFFHTSREALIGTKLIDHVPRDQRPGVRDRLAAITLNQPTETQLHRLTQYDYPVYILWTNIGLFEDDQLVGYQSVGRNITNEVLLQQEVKAQAAKLESVQQELRVVLDHVPSRIWYKDDKNTILRLNAAAASSMGLSVQAVEGRNTYDLFGPAAKAYHDDDLQVIRSGKPMLGKIEAYTPNDGDQGWVSTDKIPLTDVGSDEPRILVVSTDVTTLKEKETMLETINKNLDDFASLTSHDLQAPLRKIGISAELMEMEFEDVLPEEAKSYLGDMRDGVDHMRNMIRSFLRFMRQSPSSVELETVDLNRLLERVVERERDALSGIGAKISLPGAKSVHIAGDAALLEQVFANLIQNSVKYRDPDRVLEIGIRAFRDNQFWAVDVTDNGAGIDPLHSEKVFDLFSRSKPKHEQMGSGIGLALCRRILTMHGGSIELVEGEETGSRFRIKLYRKRLDA